MDCRNGGILPPVAQSFHRQNMDQNVSATFAKAGMTMDDVDAIAVTTRPGSYSFIYLLSQG